MSVLITGSLVTALASPDKSKSAPDEIVFIPEGSHKIFPLSAPKGVTVHLPAEKGEAIAAAMNAKLQARIKETVSPWFDIEHTRKFPASGYPTSFRYEEGRGIIAAVDWSDSGRKAIEGRDVRYFSPEFYINADGIPTGIPERGPLGGLVTEPAFREIGAIAASDAGEETNLNHPHTMSQRILAALAISASDETAETAAVDAIEKLKSEIKMKQDELAALTAERDEMKGKIEAAEAKEVEAVKERADTLVKAAVADGRLLAKDTEKQDKFREKISAGDSFAEEILAQLPKVNGDLDKQIVKAGAVAGQDNETRVTAALASARTELGESAVFQIVWERAAEIDPQAFA